MPTKVHQQIDDPDINFMHMCGTYPLPRSCTHMCGLPAP